jgi:DNA-binding response OmpR family regulator
VPDSTPPSDPAHILLVEDDELLRELLVDVLEWEGFPLLVADAPSDALKRVADRTEPIPLAIVDVAMPHMNGMEFAKRLRDLRPETRVLFMSSYPLEELAGMGTFDPSDQFIGKPFSCAALVTQARQILEDPS